MPPSASSSSSRSYRDNQQRFHKGRQGRLLVPHGPLSGLLFSVNPRQDAHALREAREYCHSITEDLQRAYAEAVAAIALEGDPNGDEIAVTDVSLAQQSAPVSSTSHLLAAELAAYTTPTMAAHPHSKGGESRKRARGSASDEDDEDDDKSESSRCAQTRDKAAEAEGRGGGVGRHGGKTRPNARQQWFAPLETTCKGYVLLNIPILNPQATCIVAHAGAADTAAVETTPAHQNELEKKSEGTRQGENEGEKSANVANAGEGVRSGTAAAEGGVLPAHSIVLNPVVSLVVERVFRDLLRTPRPVFKHCFRLFPAELTCCPTLAEMQKAMQTLLQARFPRFGEKVASNTSARETSATAAEDLSWSQALPFYEPGRAADVESGASLVRPMYKVILNFSVKNNTNVEKKKTEVLAALQAAIPANRFILLRGSSVTGKNKIKADASIIVAVLHATCVMGVQMHYEDRCEYNVHAMGEKALELSNTVTSIVAPDASGE